MHWMSRRRAGCWMARRLMRPCGVCWWMGYKGSVRWPARDRAARAGRLTSAGRAGRGGCAAGRDHGRVGGELRAGRWQPCLARDAAGAPVAFAPYLLTHRSDAQMSRWTASARLPNSSMARKPSRAATPTAARRQVAASIERAVRGMEKRHASIQRELRPAEEIERLRASGEWILALATQIAARQAELVLPEGVELPTVRLDPALCRLTMPRPTSSAIARPSAVSTWGDCG